MSPIESDARAKLPNRGNTVTVSSRHREMPTGYSDDSKGEQITEKNWKEFANCRGMNVSDFFFSRTDPKSKWKKAMLVCKDCRVKKSCLLIAINQIEDDHGLFGGQFATERRKIRAMLKSDPNYLETPEAIERYGLENAY